MLARAGIVLARTRLSARYFSHVNPVFEGGRVVGELPGTRHYLRTHHLVHLDTDIASDIDPLL